MIDRSTIKLFRRNELITGRHQCMHDNHLRRMAGRDRKTSSAAFKCSNTLFQDGAGRIADARIDVAEGLKAK